MFSRVLATSAGLEKMAAAAGPAAEMAMFMAWRSDGLSDAACADGSACVAAMADGRDVSL